MCDVCNGSGRYPIFTRFGKELYSIRCPECGSAPAPATGGGETPAELQAQIARLQSKLARLVLGDPAVGVTIPASSTEAP